MTGSKFTLPQAYSDVNRQFFYTAIYYGARKPQFMKLMVVVGYYFLVLCSENSWEVLSQLKSNVSYHQVLHRKLPIGLHCL
jgi:hypothetical protein